VVLTPLPLRRACERNLESYRRGILAAQHPNKADERLIISSQYLLPRADTILPAALCLRWVLRVGSRAPGGNCDGRVSDTGWLSSNRYGWQDVFCSFWMVFKRKILILCFAWHVFYFHVFYLIFIDMIFKNIDISGQEKSTYLQIKSLAIELFFEMTCIYANYCKMQNSIIIMNDCISHRI
jgi:hypothetical protein